MSKDLIRYDLQVQNALKGVIRKVMTEAARDGLPGDHHFYITFKTRAPGVRLSQHLRDTYPDEMTIVLQHQFWDLAVTEHAFEVGLSFRGVPERLLIPFDALTVFFDPSVQFGLKFGAEDEDGIAAPEESVPPAKPVAQPARPTVPVRASDGEAPAPAKGKGRKAEKAAEKAEEVAAEAEPGATVVSLDAFRKK